MTRLERELAVYAAYHQDPRNRALHFVGVPLIMLGLFAPLGPYGLLVAAAALAYYFWLDLAFAACMLLVVAALLPLSALAAARLGTWPAFIFCFGGGWSLQLLGHTLERRRPAMTDNLLQALIAPLFLLAEAVTAAGLRPGLKTALRPAHIPPR